MGQLENWKMTPLDALLCNNQLQILKTLVFFFPPARQRPMILLIKFMELRQCMTLPLAALSAFSYRPEPSQHGTDIVEHIFPYCDPEKQQMFRQMQNAFQMMKTVQQFSDSGMFDNLSEMMGGMGGFGGLGGMDAFAQMAGMAGAGTNTPQQSDSFDDHGHSDHLDTFSERNQPSANSLGNTNLSSMLSSMMNPEQQALFEEYEAMLDNLS